MPTIMENGKLKNLSVAEYNEYVASLRANLKLNDDGTLKGDKVEDLDKIWVNGQEFSGMSYQGFLTVNTKTYVEEPSRANDGSIPNINDYDTFIVPRCKVNFKYFSSDDYRRMCEAVQSNEFTVKYYDKQFNEFVIHKMYCEPEEMFKLYNVGTEVFGLLDYEISFIGTLNDLSTYKVSYNSNGGQLSGNPTPYDSTIEYQRGDKVYLDDNRYFEAIYYENTFSNKPLSNTTYWLEHNLYEYSGIAYKEKDVVYEKLEKGRKYYIAKKDVPSKRPLTDTDYWETINVQFYDSTKTYSSNKTSELDSTLGDFAISAAEITLCEAIYYYDKFSGKDPTNTKYWKQLALGIGIDVKWGNSIIIAHPETLFSAPEGKSSDKWNTKQDGSGFTYYPNQSLNVFRDLTLYAIWE